jgi:hypothetical protein
LIGVDVGSHDALVANSEIIHINFVRCGTTAASVRTMSITYLSSTYLPPDGPEFAQHFRLGIRMSGTSVLRTRSAKDWAAESDIFDNVRFRAAVGNTAD